VEANVPARKSRSALARSCRLTLQKKGLSLSISFSTTLLPFPSPLTESKAWLLHRLACLRVSICDARQAGQS
jgi:hypothetical protein